MIWCNLTIQNVINQLLLIEWIELNGANFLEFEADLVIHIPNSRIDSNSFIHLVSIWICLLSLKISAYVYSTWNTFSYFFLFFWLFKSRVKWNETKTQIWIRVDRFILVHSEVMNGFNLIFKNDVLYWYIHDMVSKKTCNYLLAFKVQIINTLNISRLLQSIQFCRVPLIFIFII